MAIEHVNIPDSQLHEPKGAVAATDGHALFSTGSGQTSFRAIESTDVSGLKETTSITDELLSESFTTQLVPSGSTELISFNSSVATSPEGYITINGDEIIFNVTGLYSLEVLASVTRSTNSGHSVIFIRGVLNDVPLATSVSISIDSANDTFSSGATFSGLREFTAGDVFKVELLHDSGSGNAGVQQVTPVASGWPNSPSSRVRVSRVEVV